MGNKLFTKQDVLWKLIELRMNSCTCLTKTPDHLWHKEACNYRKLVEISEWVRNLPDSVV